MFFRRSEPPAYWEKGHLSFCGAGYLGCYHVGVSLVFKEFAPHIAARSTVGASSGALVAMLHVIDMPIASVIERFTEMAVYCRSLVLGSVSARFAVIQEIRRDLQAVVPVDAHRRANGRLFVSVTRVPTLQNELISEFASRNDLIETVLASCYVPYFAGVLPTKLKGNYYLDGGLTRLWPKLNDHTITVSTLYGFGCLRPQSTLGFLSPFNLIQFAFCTFAGSPSSLEQIFYDGVQDGLRFIRDNDLYACSSCAKLPHRPRRGDCVACVDVLKKIFEFQAKPEYVESLRRAQEAEDALKAAQPFRYSLVGRILVILLAVLYFPLDNLFLAAETTYNYWAGNRSRLVK